MKKFTKKQIKPVLLVVFLILSMFLIFKNPIPPASANPDPGAIILPVTGWVNETDEWHTVGSSPWLDSNDNDSSYIWTGDTPRYMSYFTFASLDTRRTITSVRLVGKCRNALGMTLLTTWYLWNGTDFEIETSVGIAGTEWVCFNVTADVLGTDKALIQNTRLKIKSTSGGGDGRITYVFLEVYTEEQGIAIENGESIDDGADWVFTNWKYYNFTVEVAFTGLDNVTMNFTIPTSFENVNCDFCSDGANWTYSSNMTYESRYGEPVLLRAGIWEEMGGTTYVSFLIWFQEIVLDVWEPADAIPVDVSYNGSSYYSVSSGLFRIYSKGGFSLNTYSSNSSHAWILDGGTPFSFHVEDDGGYDNVYMYNEIWFRDVQHIKLLPEIHFITGADGFDIRYGCDYSFGDGAWQPGWFMDINPDVVHYNGLFTAAVWTNMTVWFYNREIAVSYQNLYMYNHGSITGGGCPGWLELYVDLWISDKNASSVGAARVNAYEYAMEDNADLWLRWLSNNWAPMDDVYKEFSGEAPILGSANNQTMSSESVMMWRYWSQVRVFSAGGGQEIEVRNFEQFDDTRSQILPLTGISTPVFDETVTPVVGQKGLLGALFTMFSSLGSFLSENILFGGLNLWGNFVDFLDSIAGLFGQPRFFTNLFTTIGEFIGYLGTSLGYMGIIINSLFLLIASLLASFLTQMGNLIASLVTTLSYFGDMMGGAYGVGVNIWDDLGISTWIMVVMVFYPLYLIIMWDEQGEAAVINHLTMVFGILSWLFDFFISLGQFILRLIVTIIESIPIVE